MALFSKEMFELNRKVDAAQRESEERARQERALKTKAERDQLSEDQEDLRTQEIILDRKAAEVARRERLSADKEAQLAQLENMLSPSSEESVARARSDYAKKRYFGFAPHNTTANALLFLVIRQESEKLQNSVNRLPSMNDFELPAYFQEGVYNNLDETERVALTPLEAALWLMHDPSLNIFQRDITDRLNGNLIKDETYQTLLKKALHQIERAKKDFRTIMKTRMEQFIRGVEAEFVRNDPEGLDAILRRADIRLKSLKRAETEADTSLPEPTSYYWMALPMIVGLLKSTFDKMPENFRKAHIKRILNEMIKVYLTVSFEFVALQRDKRTDDFQRFNRMFVGSSQSQWEHYTSSEAAFDEEGRELSGDIGQRYHNLRFDEHTGQLFNEAGDEVELIDSLYGDTKRLFKKGGQKTADLAKRGYAKTKKAFSGPPRVYFLFLNEGNKSGPTTLVDTNSYFTTAASVKVNNKSPRGTISVEGKGAKKGILGKRSTLVVNYPALIVIPWNKNPNFSKFYVVAHASGDPRNFEMTPTGQTFSGDSLVKAFWKGTRTAEFKEGLNNESDWYEKLKVLFERTFASAERHYIGEEINSSTSLVAGPFSHPIDEETLSQTTAASSFSSSLEQF